MAIRIRNCLRHCPTAPATAKEAASAPGSPRDADGFRWSGRLRGTIGKSALWIGGSLLAVAIALPVVGQESLLPPGFENTPTRPAPSPAPAPTPAPRPATPTSPGTSAPRPTANSGPTSAPRPASAQPGSAPVLLGPDGLPLPGQGDTTEDLPLPPPRYDLPPGSRRLLSRVGPLTAETGSLPANAFGNRGLYLTAIINKTEGQLVSRWASILLRRALLSAVDTPRTVNGADFASARAMLLLRQGDANAARMLVQSVDVDKASARMRQTVMQVFIANADPAGLCPYVPAIVGQGDERWDAAQAMCSALVGEPGPANAVLERLRRRGEMAAIDVKLAEKVVGSGLNSRRSATVLWDDVGRLTPWRFGLATATGVDIPASLWRTATPAMQQWAVQAPMIGVEQRLAWAPAAAAKGVLSARAYVDLMSWAADRDDASDDTIAKGRDLRLAFVAADLSVRVASIVALGADDGGGYAGKVLGARAAARVAPVDLDDAEAHAMLQAMFAGGLDSNAMAWAGNVRVGSQGWGLLAVGSPRPLVGVDAGAVGDFADDDDSVDALRTRFLAAALIGLGRVDQDNADDMARDYELALGTDTRWTRGIRLAAERGEAGTVALLVATGLQGRDWRGVPPYHLYQITRALRMVGLGAEARMIAAEALTRA